MVGKLKTGLWFVFGTLLVLNIERLAESLGVDLLLTRLQGPVGEFFQIVIAAPWLIPAFAFVAGLVIGILVGSRTREVPPATTGKSLAVEPGAPDLPRMSFREMARYVHEESNWQVKAGPGASLVSDLRDYLAHGYLTAYGRLWCSGAAGPIGMVPTSFWERARLYEQDLLGDGAPRILSDADGLEQYSDVRFYEQEVKAKFPPATSF